jgi:hypothetical protein
MCNYLLEVYKKTIDQDTISEMKDPEVFDIIDNITNAYIEYSTYNEGTDKSLLITLKDTTRIFVDLYNSAIFIKSIQLVDMFLNNKIARFDVSEKNEDDTPKTKLELDIIRSINNNFSYYVQLNDDILKHMKSVVEPARRSSNTDLQTFLKGLFRPNNSKTKSTANPDENLENNYALVDIYNKYITNMRKTISDDVRDKYMYTGISSIVNNDPKTEELGKECPEVYVYVNVIEKDEYEKSTNRECIMTDDLLANNLKQLLFSNTMMDGTFPEVNQYRSFRFLKGTALDRLYSAFDREPDNSLNKSNSTNPYLVQPRARTGGYRGSPRKLSNARLCRSKNLTKRKHACYKQRSKTAKHFRHTPRH